MARVNVDGKVWKDPRVKRLAKRRSWSMREVVGTLTAVWDVAYDNKTEIMPRIDVDTAAESDDFAADMIAEDLAQPIGDDLVRVRLRGVKERIAFLLLQAEKGRKGGRAKARRVSAEGQFEPTTKPGLDHGQAAAKQPGSLPLTLTPDLPLPPDHDQQRAPNARRTLSDKAAELAAVAVDAINSLTGKCFRQTSKATLDDCTKLARHGVTATQLRAAVLHVGKPWVGHPIYDSRVCPSTLLQVKRVLAAIDEIDAGPARPGLRIVPNEQPSIAFDDGSIHEVPA